MDNKDLGARPADQALPPSAPEPFGLSPSGNDPSRVFAEMDRYLDAAREVRAVPEYFLMADSLLRDLSTGTARLASYRDVPVRSNDSWSWGWMLWVSKDLFRWQAHFFEPASGISASGQDAERLEAKPASPVAESETPTPNPIGDNQ